MGHKHESQMVPPKLGKPRPQLKFSSCFVVLCSLGGLEPTAVCVGAWCVFSLHMHVCMYVLLEWAERVRLSPLVSSAPQLPRCLRWRRSLFREKLKLKVLMFDRRAVTLARLLSG